MVGASSEACRDGSNCANEGGPSVVDAAIR
jgi:hypothetical protein